MLIKLVYILLLAVVVVLGLPNDPHQRQVQRFARGAQRFSPHYHDHDFGHDHFADHHREHDFGHHDFENHRFHHGHGKHHDGHRHHDSDESREDHGYHRHYPHRK